MTTDDKIRDEKLQYDINREAPKILALSSGKFDKYEFLAGEETLPPDQWRVIEEAKFAYSSLGKLLKNKQKQLINKGKKLAEALEVLDPEKKFKLWNFYQMLLVILMMRILFRKNCY